MKAALRTEQAVRVDTRAAAVERAAGHVVAVTEPPLNVLLVDDWPEQLVVLERILSELGQNFVRAHSCAEALERVEEQDFAVILLDVQMPGVDGFETAARIRSRPASRHTPIIFLSGVERADAQMFRGYLLGAVDYVLKPVLPDVIRAKVAVFIELARKNRLLEEQAELLRTSYQELVKLTRTQSEWLEEMDRAVKTAVQARDDFLCVASHELHTPLTPLRIHVEALRRLAAKSEMVPGAHLLERVGKIQKQCTRLERLVDHLLDVSRVSARRLDLEPERLCLVELVREVVERTRDERGSQGPPIRLEAPQQARGVWDRLRVEQIITNLLSNAVKYGGGEPVEVAVRVVGDRARLSVRDHGEGVPIEQQDRIFERFERSAPRKEGGLGLGLWIVKQIALAHGGGVRVESERGVGANFIVDLPLETRTVHA